MKNIKPCGIIVATLSIILGLWVVLSWFEVVSLNSMPNPAYSDWNIFKLLF